MSVIEKSIEVNCPVHTAYNQWTQFEDFPKFMEGVKQVSQLDDTHMHWRAEVGGKEKEWDCEITEQIPDERIAWRSTSGTPNEGIVTFIPIGVDKTMVNLKMSYQPEGMTENIGDMAALPERRVEGDMQRFKEFLESRGHETGAWRGQVGQGQTRPPG